MHYIHRIKIQLLLNDMHFENNRFARFILHGESIIFNYFNQCRLIGNTVENRILHPGKTSKI